MATLVHGKNFGSTETVTAEKLHQLVDLATISGITNDDISSDAGIDSSKISFSLADYVTLAGTQTISGSKTFSGTTNFTGTTNIGVPIGGLIPWTTITAPSGWLICDGSEISRTTYSALFGVISTIYGIGDNATTFNIPNLKGRVPVGFDATQTEFSDIAETGGEKTHALEVGEITAHSHFTAKSATGAPTLDANNAIAVTNNSGTDTKYILANGGTGADVGLSSEVGSGTAHNNLQPYIVLNYIIRYS